MTTMTKLDQQDRSRDDSTVEDYRRAEPREWWCHQKQVQSRYSYSSVNIVIFKIEIGSNKQTDAAMINLSLSLSLSAAFKSHPTRPNQTRFPLHFVLSPVIRIPTAGRQFFTRQEERGRRGDVAFS